MAPLRRRRGDVVQGSLYSVPSGCGYHERMLRHRSSLVALGFAATSLGLPAHLDTISGWRASAGLNLTMW